MAARLRASWKVPRLVEASPRKVTAMRPLFLCLQANAAPVPMCTHAPTMPLAPRTLSELSAMCIEPPLPLQKPSTLPNSSANMRLVSAPLAIR